MKPVIWIGSSLKDVRAFPEEARQEVGYSVYLAQKGDKGINAVPMVGFGGAKVLEVVIEDTGDAFRAVYTVKFARAIYVLHAFQKKSKRGIATPQHDINLIHKRLRQAEQHYMKIYDGQKERRNDTRA